VPKAPKEQGGLSPADAADLELKQTPAGTRMRLHVKAGSRKNAILGVRAGALQICVSAAPERGKANRGVMRLLARTLELPVTSLELIAGRGSRDKTVLVPAAPKTILIRLS